MTLYFEKNREGAQALSTLPKYSLVRITGEVISVFRGQPWINCHSVVPYKGVGAFNDNAIYHLQQAVTLDEESRIDLADEHFEFALVEDIPLASRAAVRELQAHTLVESGRFQKAADVLAEALALLDEFPLIERDLLPSMHHLRAKALSEMAGAKVAEVGDAALSGAEKAMFEEAVGHARLAVQLDPQLGGAYAVLGISLAGLEMFEEAKRECQRAIRLQPENAEVRWYLGRILDMQGKFTEAIETLKEAIDLEPKDYRLHKAIALSYFHRAQEGGRTAQKDVETALLEYDISLRLESDDTDLHHYAGLVLEFATEQGYNVRAGMKQVPASYEMAISRFHDALAHDPSYAESHVRLAYRYQYAGEHDIAVGHFRSAIELLPERVALYQDLSAYLWSLDRKAKPTMST